MLLNVSFVSKNFDLDSQNFIEHVRRRVLDNLQCTVSKLDKEC